MRAKQLAVAATELSEEEEALYEEQKQLIQSGLTGAAKAVEVVRKKKLYRNEYATLNDFCRDQLRMSASAFYKSLEAEEVRKSLVEHVPQNSKAHKLLKNVSPRALREVKKLPPAKAVETIQEVAAANNGIVTAAGIQIHRGQRPPPLPEPRPASGGLKPVAEAAAKPGAEKLSGAAAKIMVALEEWWQANKAGLTAYSSPSPADMVQHFRNLIEATL